MIESLMGLEQVNILQCQSIAKQIGFETTTFDLCGPKKTLKCVWTDAHLGLFTIIETDQLVHVKTFQFAQDLWCRNISVPGAEELEQVSVTFDLPSDLKDRFECHCRGRGDTMGTVLR